jgi:hypothetical protein
MVRAIDIAAAARTQGERSVSLREASTLAETFVDVARFLLMSKSSDSGNPIDLAQAHGRTRAAIILKNGIAPGNTTDPNWAAPLSGYNAAAAAWLDSLRSQSAFDAMLSSMVQVPLRVRVGISSLGVTGYVRGEGSAKRLSTMSLAAGGMEAFNAVAWILVTKELSKLAGPTGASMLDRELRAAVASVTDEKFISVIIAGKTPIQSNGSTISAVRSDLAAALAEIEIGVGSKLFVLTTSKITKAWSTSNRDGGAAAFPDMGPTGGMICKMPVIASAGVPDGHIVVVDGAGIAAASQGIRLEVLRNATVDVGGPPDSPSTAGTTLISIWQENLVGLAADRYFGVERLRDSAVAVIDNVSYSGDSP